MTQSPQSTLCSLSEWIDAYGEALLRHLSSMLGNVDDAEDVLQQVWITADQRPPDQGSDGNVRAWLYRVGTNKALDCLARDKRRRTLLERRGPHPSLAWQSDPTDGLTDRTRDAVRKQIAKLPRKQREAVWFRWVEDCEYTTIARRLDTSVESARANVYHGLKRLRKELEEVWNEERAP